MDTSHSKPTGPTLQNLFKQRRSFSVPANILPQSQPNSSALGLGGTSNHNQAATTSSISSLIKNDGGLLSSQKRESLSLTGQNDNLSLLPSNSPNLRQRRATVSIDHKTSLSRIPEHQPATQLKPFPDHSNMVSQVKSTEFQTTKSKHQDTLKMQPEKIQQQQQQQKQDLNLILNQNELLRQENYKLAEKLEKYLTSLPLLSSPTRFASSLQQPLDSYSSPIRINESTFHAPQPQQNSLFNPSSPQLNTFINSTTMTTEKYELSRSLATIDFEFSELKRQVESYQSSNGTFVAFGHITCIETILRTVQQLQRFVEVETALNPISLHVLKLNTTELLRLASSYKTMMKDCFLMFEHGETMNKERKQERYKMEKLLAKLKDKTNKESLNYQEEIKILKTSLMKLDTDMKKSNRFSSSARKIEKEEEERQMFLLKKELSEKYLGLIEELKIKFNQVTEENVQVKNYCRDLEVAIDKWHVENHKLRELVGQMKREVGDMNVEMERGRQIKEQHITLQADHEILQSVKSNLEKRLIELEAEKKHLSQTMDTIKQELCQLKAKEKEDPKTDDIHVLLQAMIASNLASQKPGNGVSEKDQQQTEEEKKLDILIKLLNEEKNNDQSTVELKNLIEEQKSAMEKLNLENSSLKTQIQQLRKEYKSKQESLAQEINKIQTEFHSSQQEFHIFEGHLHEYERQHRDITVMLNTISEIGGLSILQESIGGKTKEAKGHPYLFGVYFKELQNLYVKLKEEHQIDKSKINELSSQERVIKQQNEALQFQLKSKQDAVIECKQQIANLQNKCEEIEKLRHSAELNKEQLQAKLKKLVQGCKNIFGHPLSFEGPPTLVPKKGLTTRQRQTLKSNSTRRRERTRSDIVSSLNTTNESLIIGKDKYDESSSDDVSSVHDDLSGLISHNPIEDHQSSFLSISNL